MFGPKPRRYDYALPKKVERGALRAAIAIKLREGDVTVVDALHAAEAPKTKPAAELLKRLGCGGQGAVRRHPAGRELRRVGAESSGRARRGERRALTARDVADASRLVATRAAVERLQEVLG